MIIINISIIKLVKTKEVKSYSTIVINFLVLFLLHNFGNKIGIKMEELGSIAMDLAFLIIKIYYISKVETISYFNILNYIFFIPSLGAGPVVEYEFLQSKIAFNRKKISIGFLKALICMLLSLKSDKYLLNEDLNFKEQKLPLKLFDMYLFALNFRLKFYFTWEFSALCYLVNGYEVKNYNFRFIEFSTSLSETIRNWNMYVYSWLKTAFFLPLLKESTFLAAMVTFTCSAFWHGGKSTDLITAFIFSLAIPILKENNVYFIKHLKSRVANGINSIQTIFFLTYLPLPFAFDDVKESFFIYKELYFCGHIFLLCSLIFHLCNYILKEEGLVNYKLLPKEYKYIQNQSSNYSEIIDDKNTMLDNYSTTDLKYINPFDLLYSEYLQSKFNDRELKEEFNVFDIFTGEIFKKKIFKKRKFIYIFREINPFNTLFNNSLENENNF